MRVVNCARIERLNEANLEAVEQLALVMVNERVMGIDYS